MTLPNSLTIFLKIIFAFFRTKNWNYEKDYNLSVTDTGGFEEIIAVLPGIKSQPSILWPLVAGLGAVPLSYSRLRSLDYGHVTNVQHTARDNLNPRYASETIYLRQSVSLIKVNFQGNATSPPCNGIPIPESWKLFARGIRNPGFNFESGIPY